MLVSRQLSDEIDKLLPKMQEDLATEADAILASMGDVMPTAVRTKALIKGEDINIMLKHEIRIWRRYYG